jgi:hypothetical protein
VNGGEVDEPSAVRELAGDLARDLDRKTRLADAAGADDRDDTRLRLQQQPPHAREIEVAPDERFRRAGEVRRRGGRERREFGPAELEQVHGIGEAL